MRLPGPPGAGGEWGQGSSPGSGRRVLTGASGMAWPAPQGTIALKWLEWHSRFSRGGDVPRGPRLGNTGRSQREGLRGSLGLGLAGLNHLRGLRRPGALRSGTCPGLGLPWADGQEIEAPWEPQEEGRWGPCRGWFAFVKQGCCHLQFATSRNWLTGRGSPLGSGGPRRGSIRPRK